MLKETLPKPNDAQPKGAHSRLEVSKTYSRDTEVSDILQEPIAQSPNSSKAKLEIPRTREVEEQLKAGGASTTFLDLALGIVARLEQELGSRNGELPFLRDCLNAGHSQTSLS